MNLNMEIEEGINLWDEIKKLEMIGNNNDDSNDLCLLSNEPLTKNHIKLPCNHCFNYIPLYNELYHLKIKFVHNYFDKYKLKKNQIHCPYCRTHYDFLLPYIPIYKSEKVREITHPIEFSMSFKKCEYHIKTGKKKGICNENGFETDIGNRCVKHWKLLERQKEKEKEKEKNKDNNKDSNKEKDIKSKLPSHWFDVEENKELWKMNVKTLKEKAKEKGIKYYYKMNKTDLLQKLTNHN